jgi:hypothetical protein
MPSWVSLGGTALVVINLVIRRTKMSLPEAILMQSSTTTRFTPGADWYLFLDRLIQSIGNHQVPRIRS